MSTALRSLTVAAARKADASGLLTHVSSDTLDERDASVDVRAAIRQNQQSGTPAESARPPAALTAITIIEPVWSAARHMCSLSTTTKTALCHTFS